MLSPANSMTRVCIKRFRLNLRHVYCAAVFPSFRRRIWKMGFLLIVENLEMFDLSGGEFSIKFLSVNLCQRLSTHSSPSPSLLSLPRRKRLPVPHHDCEVSVHPSNNPSLPPSLPHRVLPPSIHHPILVQSFRSSFKVDGAALGVL